MCWFDIDVLNSNTTRVQEVLLTLFKALQGKNCCFQTVNQLKVIIKSELLRWKQMVSLFIEQTAENRISSAGYKTTGRFKKQLKKLDFIRKSGVNAELNDRRQLAVKTEKSRTRAKM